MAVLKDSGERRQFESGAVRDIQEGKGRCDLLLLEVVAELMDTNEAFVLVNDIADYIESGNVNMLYEAIRRFFQIRGWSNFEGILEVAKQYEDGAVKYGERNWEKGILIHCYIDSGIRHFLKYMSGMDDEPHDRAFVWNMLGAIWTHKHLPHLIDLPFKVVSDKKSRIPEVHTVLLNNN